MSIYHIDKEISKSGKTERIDTDRLEGVTSDGCLGGNGVTRSITLYIAKRSERYFLLHQTMWQGEKSHIEEVSFEEAVDFAIACNISEERIAEITTSKFKQALEKELEKRTVN